jgi:rhodanese-related sulfurtransferase
MQQLSASDLAAWLADAGRPQPQLLDVREGWEVALARIPGSVHVPIGEVTRRLDEIDRTRPVVCVCHHGMRSQQVAVFLERNGFGQVSNLAGGIDAWARDADPGCPTY